MLTSTYKIQEMTRPVDKKSRGVLYNKKEEQTRLFKTCPTLIKEPFNQIQVRLFGRVICKDITAWIIGRLLVEGLYSFTSNKADNKFLDEDAPFNWRDKYAIDTSLWVARCLTCGSYQIYKYSMLKDFTRAPRRGRCDHCKHGITVVGL